MSHSTLPGTGPWSWLEPGLWVYRARELDLLGQADELLADAAPAARAGGAALLEAKRRLHAAGVGAATAPAAVGGGGHRFVVQVAIQFLAGYRDLNLRDAAHVGHGAVLCHDPEWHGRRELAAVIRGALVGLAATEEPVRPAADADRVGPGRGGDPGGAYGRRLGDHRPQGVGVPGAGGGRVRGVRAQPGAPQRVLRAGRLARAVHHAGRPAGRRGRLVLGRAEPAAGAGAGLRGARRRGRRGGRLPPALRRVPAAGRGHLPGRRGGGRGRLGGAGAVRDRSTAAGRLPDGTVERLGDLRGRVLVALGGLFTGAARPGGIDSSWSKMVKAQAVQTAIEVVRAVEHAMLDGGAAPDAGADAIRRTRQELSAFEAADGAPASLLRSAGERFVQYSAAILDEISEPTSTMPRPRLPD